VYSDYRYFEEHGLTGQEAAAEASFGPLRHRRRRALELRGAAARRPECRITRRVSRRQQKPRTRSGCRRWASHEDRFVFVESNTTGTGQIAVGVFSPPGIT
jgi:hypothetical protein